MCKLIVLHVDSAFPGHPGSQGLGRNECGELSPIIRPLKARREDDPPSGLVEPPSIAIASLEANSYESERATALKVSLSLYFSGAIPQRIMCPIRLSESSLSVNEVQSYKSLFATFVFSRNLNHIKKLILVFVRKFDGYILIFLL